MRYQTAIRLLALAASVIIISACSGEKNTTVTYTYPESSSTPDNTTENNTTENDEQATEPADAVVIVDEPKEEKPKEPEESKEPKEEEKKEPVQKDVQLTNLVDGVDFVSHAENDADTVTVTAHIELNIAAARELDWHVQLNYPLPVEANKTYTVCFDVWADTAREINMDVDTGPTDYATLIDGFETISITTEKTAKIIQVTTTQADDTARLVFNAGLSEHNVYLDNIAFYDGEGCGTGKPNGVPSNQDFTGEISTELDFTSSATYPFPHNAGYAHGVTSELVSANELKLDYNKWKNAFIETCNDGSQRLVYPQFAEGDSGPKRHTNSEGIGYAMLIAAYMGDKDLVDGLYQFYKRFDDASGHFMHWRVLSCDPSNEEILTGAATDGDLDVAFALVVADKQWGGSYGPEATQLITAMREFFFIDCQGRTTLKPGDAFGGCNCINPSYYSPAYYRVFAEYDDSPFWTKARMDAYGLLDDGQDNETGLIRAWSTAFGNSATQCFNQSSGGGGADDYQFDAMRTPWRVGTDYVWTGHNDAKTWLDNIRPFIDSQPVEHIMPSYYLDGTPFAWDRSMPFPKDAPNADGTRSSAMVGGFASAQLAGSQEKIDQMTSAWQSIYKRHDWRAPGDGWAYNASLSLLYGLLISGNFWDPLNPQDAVAFTVDADSPDNLIDNGQFNDHLHRWFGGAWEDNTGHLTIDDGQLRFVISDVTNNAQDRLVAEQLYIAVEAGQSYTLTFDSKAQAARELGVIISSATDLIIVDESIDLTTSFDEFQVSIDVPANVGYINLTFTAGHSTEDVWLDNITIFKD